MSNTTRSNTSSLVIFIFGCSVATLPGFNQLCDAPLMNIEYKMTFENAVNPANAQSGYTHLGANERPVLVVLIISACFQLAILIFAVMVMGWLKNHSTGNMLHHTVKILFTCIVLTFLGSLLYAIHLGVLSGDGRGVVALLYMAHVCYALSTSLMLLEIIVITKGWTIVRRKISAGGRMKIAAFITTFFVLYLTCIFWAILNQDISKYSTIYETPPGIALIVIRFLAGMWFMMVRDNMFL